MFDTKAERKRRRRRLAAIVTAAVLALALVTGAGSMGLFGGGSGDADLAALDSNGQAQGAVAAREGFSGVFRGGLGGLFRGDLSAGLSGGSGGRERLQGPIVEALGPVVVIAPRSPIPKPPPTPTTGAPPSPSQPPANPDPGPPLPPIPPVAPAAPPIEGGSGLAIEIAGGDAQGGGTLLGVTSLGANGLLGVIIDANQTDGSATGIYVASGDEGLDVDSATPIDLIDSTIGALFPG